MDVFEAMRARHSVRKYLDKPIPAEVLAKLREEVDACNREGHLHIQLVVNEPKAFDCVMARYGSFSGVANYFVLVGPDDDRLEERAGYYGEKLVILAQTLGINTCWVGLTFSKKKAHIEIGPGEKLALVIALGYGADQGTAHRDKPMEKLCRTEGDMPDWFRRGMEYAMLAPTAINQQKFRIVKYHFELGAGRENFSWAN